MSTYYIELDHEDGDCVSALKEVHALGYITHFEWGCKYGKHVGFFRMETDDDNDPLRILPPAFRHTAKIVKVAKFTPEQVQAMHDK